MSLVQKDPAEYTLSQDELMLKELERRDGIYSFIFHELERPKDMQMYAADSTSKASTCHVRPNQVIIVEDTDSEEIKLETSYNNSSATSLTFTSSLGLAIETASSENCQNVTTPNKASSSGVFKSSCLEFSGIWNPTFTSCKSSLSSCRFFTQSKLYDFIATNSIQVRNSTPRFSNIYVPLVRNRRHALKDTAEYRRSHNSAGGPPDLRALFPYDPDVHAPFVELLKQTDVAKVEVDGDVA